MQNIFSIIEHSLQNIIDKLRGKPNILALSEYTTTLAGLVKMSASTETVILGSSHFKYGYLPQKNQYNISMASQDLYYSYELYKKYAKDVKNIVLGFSYFSPFHVLVKCIYADLAMVMKVIEGIDYQYPEEADKKELDKLEKKYRNFILKSYKRKINLTPNNFTGGMTSYKGYYAEPDEEFINTIRKTFNREHTQILYLRKIIEETIKNNQNLLIVYPPLSEDFRKNFENENRIVFDELHSIAKEYPSVKLVSYYDDKDFSKEDFEDIQHLSYSGAKKLTQKIQYELKNFS